MPRIVDKESGVERVVSDEEVRRILEFGDGRVLRYASDSNKTVFLKNVLDGTILGPIDPYFAYGQYLQKIVARCSACGHTDVWEKAVTSHIAQAERLTKQHVGARLRTIEVNGERGSYLGKRCSGCGETFLARKGQGLAHLARMKAAAGLHKDAEVKTTNVYEQVMAGHPQGVLR